jgi:hypothetical protein
MHSTLAPVPLIGHPVDMTERGESASPDPAPAPRPEGIHHVFFLDPSETHPVNPNTPEGEIRNMAAFAAGVHAASPGRRAVVKVVVWLILIGIGLGIITALVNGFHSF